MGIPCLCQYASEDFSAGQRFFCAFLIQMAKAETLIDVNMKSLREHFEIFGWKIKKCINNRQGMEITFLKALFCP